MRVVLVHSFYSDGMPSGENDAVLQQFSSLQSHGFDVSLVSTDAEQAVGLSPLGLARTALRVASGYGKNPLREIVSFAPDIVHVHNLFPSWGESWLRALEVPFVVTLHNFRAICANGTLLREGNFCFECPEKGQQRGVLHSCYRGSSMATLPIALRNQMPLSARPVVSEASKLVTLSKRSRGLFEEAGVPTRKLETIPNFWVDQAGSADMYSSSIRNGWVYLGRLSNEKGLGQLLEHWPSGEVLRIFGDGPLRPYVESMENSNIVFEGFRPPEAIRGVLAESEGLIFPSLAVENSPLSYIQALSVGTPTLAFRENSVGDDIVQFGTGKILSSWVTIADSLRDLREDEGLIARCAKRFEENYSERVWVERLNQLYANAVAGVR